MLLWILIMLLSARPGNAQGISRNHKNVLVFFSLSPTTPAYQVLLDGIRMNLTREYGDNFSLHMEYLETERYPKGEYPGERFELFNKKYKSIHLDLLICVGVDIAWIIRKYASEGIKRLPAISTDFDFSRYGIRRSMAVNDRTVECKIRVDVLKPVRSALELFTETRNLYFITGTGGVDQLFCGLTRNAMEKAGMKQQSYFLCDLSMDDLLRKIQKLPPNSLIFIPIFSSDKKKVPYYNPEAVRLISTNANAPVFTLTDMGFGNGALGGHMISFHKLSEWIGKTAVLILEGRDLHSFRFTEMDYWVYQYDWRELQRWGKQRSGHLPGNGQVLFKEKDFFREYKWYIIASLVFLVKETLLVMALVRLVRKQRVATRRLMETENKYRDLFREDRILRIGQLGASLSHELNQPLTAILSTAQAGLRYLDSGHHSPELMRKILENIVEDDKRSAAILRSLRSMMKLEPREKEVVNLNDLIRELVEIYRCESIMKQVDVHLELCESAVYVMADPVQIQQVLLNLVTNATQAITRAGSENKKICIKETMDNEQVVVQVRDHGPGIDPAIKDRVFLPFVTSGGGGMGIGLAINKSILDEHNGKIKAENMPEGGAMFSFTLMIHHHEPR